MLQVPKNYFLVRTNNICLLYGEMPQKVMQVMWPIDIIHFPSLNGKTTAAVNDPMFLKKRRGVSIQLTSG